MEVQCPSCQSRFHLDDAVLRPHVKLRCSVCKFVFPLDVPEAQGNTNLDLDDGVSLGDAPAKKTKKSKLIASIVVLLLCVAAAGGWWWTSQQSLDEAAKDAAAIPENVSHLTMRNVRQYYVKNEKIGPIFVIEGKVVNEFKEPKELIAVEAAIYGLNKATLVTKKQLAGTILSLFQLQVLGEEELETFLNNKIEILTKNTNIQPGGEVPFMVLFYKPPPDVAEFGVKIVDAKNVETPQ